jgi:hypothetical protein
VPTAPPASLVPPVPPGGPASRAPWGAGKKVLVGASIGLGALVLLLVGATVAGVVLAGAMRVWRSSNEPVAYDSAYGYSAIFPGRVWDCTEDGYQMYEDTLATECSDNVYGDFMDVDVFEGGLGYYATLDSTYDSWSEAIAADPAFEDWTVSKETRADGTPYVLMYGPTGDEGFVFYNVWLEGRDYEYVLNVGSTSRDFPLEDMESLLATFQME